MWVSRVCVNLGLGQREEVIRRMAAFLSADGVIFHANRSCKPYSFGQEEIAVGLKIEGIPCILMDGDMADERDFAEGGWRNRPEAFGEQLGNEHRRGARGLKQE